MVKRSRRGRIILLSVSLVLAFTGVSAMAQSGGKRAPTLLGQLMTALQDAATAKATLKEQAKKQEEFISALAAAVDKMKAQRDGLAKRLKDRNSKIVGLVESKRRLENHLEAIKNKGLTSTQLLKAKLRVATLEGEVAEARIAELKARLATQEALVNTEVEKRMAPRIARHAKAEVRWAFKFKQIRTEIRTSKAIIEKQAGSLASVEKSLAELRAIKVKEIAATPPKAGDAGVTAGAVARARMLSIDRLLASTSALLVGRGSRQVCAPFGADGRKVCDRVSFNWAKIAARRIGRARVILRKIVSELP